MLVQVTCQWTNHHSITPVKHRCKELLQSFYSDLSLRIKGSPCSFIKLHVVSGSWLRRLQPVFVLCHVEDIDQELAAKMGASPPLPKLPQGIEARKEKLLHSSDAKNLAKTCDFQQLEGLQVTLSVEKQYSWSKTASGCTEDLLEHIFRLCRVHEVSNCHFQACHRQLPVHLVPADMKLGPNFGVFQTGTQSMRILQMI